ncbi:MAG: hypothetical protein JSW34_00075 [Candidatus Zixiibacteriota bacterium]|nr:MAG: hypothetical protein JSW34_00075 [candidate division Zixibacteria bacterium]
MKSFSFWQKWLFVVGLFLCALGVVLAFASDSSLTDFVFNDRIDPVFWENGAPSEDGLIFRGWIYGVLGSVILSWGVLIAFIAYHPFKRKERWASNCILLATLIWFIPDTVISASYGVGFNVVFNTALLIVIILPWLLTRGHFSSGRLAG